MLKLFAEQFFHPHGLIHQPLVGMPFVDSLVRGWHDSVYLHQRLLEAQRPWEQEGPLHWRRELGGWRVVGSRLPSQD